MTPAEHKTERLKRGLTQAALARIIGVAPNTLARRERGELAIKRESEMALLSIPIPRKRGKHNDKVSNRRADPRQALT